MLRFAIISLLQLLNACSASIPPVPIGEFMAGNLPLIREFFAEQLREGDVDSSALFLNGLAQIEMLEGDLEKARRHFRQAGQLMGNWQTSSAETFSAIVGAEGSKTWKGDPYEKAMNAYYTGLLYWMGGEHDNARASFKSGILADAESDEGDAQIDFALLYWLAGRMSLRMGLASEAEQFFAEAREARNFAVAHGARSSASNSILRDPSAGNLVCLIDLDIAPLKEARGLQGSVVVMQPRPSEVREVEIFIDGESVGCSELMADIDYQAITRGGQAMESIREGKAVLKTITGVGGVILLDQGLSGEGKHRGRKASIGLGLLLLSWFTHSEADVRQWETLPGAVHVLVADVLPGDHELRIVFFGHRGERISHLSRTWIVDVPTEGEGVYFFRSLPERELTEEVL